MRIPSWKEFIAGFKYGGRLSKAEEMTKSLIKDLYSTLPEYEGKDEELDMVLNYPTRVLKFLGMQTFSIFDSNIKDGATPPISDEQMVSYQNIAYLPGTMLDDFEDEVVVRYFAERDNWTEEDVLKMITDMEALYDLAKVQTPYIDSKTENKVVPLHLVRSSDYLMKLYERLIGEISESALDVYLNERDGIWPYQSKDIEVSALMRKSDVEGVMKVVGNGENYTNNLLDLLNKLGRIGGGSAAIVNEIASMGNDKHNKEETTQALRSFYVPITNFMQLGHDDISRIREDIEERTGNILILSMLPSYQTIDEPTFQKFVQERPKIISEMMIPLVEGTYAGLEQFKNLDFAFEDSKLATELSMKIVRRDVEKFCESFHIEPDLQWWERSEELKTEFK